MRSVAININTRCPLKCKHCSLGFSESFHGEQSSLSADDLSSMIAGIDSSVYDMVLLAGGEPSLNPDLIWTGIQAAKQADLLSSIVTAPIWASKAPAAQRFLDKIPGLNILILSYDDYHLEFLSRSHYRNAALQAMARGMQVVFQIAYTTEDQKSRLVGSLDGLRDQGAHIHTMRTVLVGNASTTDLDVHYHEVKDAAGLEQIPRGCVLGNAFIDESFGVHGCCWSTAAEDSPFSMKSCGRESLGKQFRQLEDDDVFQTVRRHGLIDALTDEGRQLVAQQVRGEKFGSECDLCIRLMRQEAAAVWKTGLRTDHLVPHDE